MWQSLWNVYELWLKRNCQVKKNQQWQEDSLKCLGIQIHVLVLYQQSHGSWLKV